MSNTTSGIHLSEITRGESLIWSAVSEASAVVPWGYAAAHGATANGFNVAGNASTDVPFGIVYDSDVPVGGQADIAIGGRVRVRTGAAVTAGVRATTDSLGRLINATSSVGAPQATWGTFQTSTTGAGTALLKIDPQVAFIPTSHVADETALAAIAAGSRYEGLRVAVTDGRSSWVFDADSALAATPGLVIVPAAGTGRWLRGDSSAVLRLPIAYTTADAAALLTVPEGFALRLAGHPFWHVTTGFTGGSSSAIGVSTSVSGYDTAGDLLGGASGDVAATLVAGIMPGTLGGELDDMVGFQALLLEEGAALRFNRITSVFTAGAGFACVPVTIYHSAPATP